MTDHLSAQSRRAMMQKVRQSGTAPEIEVRQFLTRHGYRYRLNMKQLVGKPDLVFTKRKKVIFVHGCFWHGHGCRYSKIPKTRTEFWIDKIRNNRARDEKVIKLLENDGWTCTTIWECEVKALKENGEKLTDFLGPARIDRENVLERF